MTDETRRRAEEARSLIEGLSGLSSPELRPEAPGTPEGAQASAEIRRRMAEIDLEDTGSIIRFGNRAQAGLQEISQKILGDVRSKDLGPAGDSLRRIVTTIRGFSAGELDMRRNRTWWERLLGRSAPFARFVAGYEQVQTQIDRITVELERHEQSLLRDIRALDLLYEQTLAFYDELALYIAAGEETLRELDRKTLPGLEARMAAAPEDQQVMEAQALRDLRAVRDDLERRVHDLKLTRQVTMQSLPSIRLVQENDKSLVAKINSTLLNTVPLWETQLAQAVTIQRGAEAARAVREAGDLTNELLTRNADTLRQSNAQIRAETERGVFDIEAVKAANAELIATIEDSLRIADEGRTRRAAAESELSAMEAELRDRLARASAPGDGTSGAAGTPRRP